MAEDAGVNLVAQGGAGFVGQMNSASGAYKGFVDGLGDGANRAPGFSEVVTGALRKMGEMAVTAGLQAAHAIGEFVVDSIKVAGDFEGGMNRFGVAIGNAMQGSGKSTEDFKQLFLTLGAELPVSTSEVQDAAIELAKGGLDPLVIAGDRAKGTMGALESSLKFAAAAQMDLKGAAELSIKMLGSFVPTTASAAEQTTFMAHAQDILVKAAGASTLDVAQLGDAMLQAGGQAKTAGLGYDDFATTMGLISPSFGSAAEAGTSFKNFLIRLIPQTTDAKAAMSDLGLVTFDTAKAQANLAAVGINAAGMSAEQMTAKMLEYAKSVGMSKKDTADWLGSMDKSAFYDAQGNFIGMEQAAQKLQDATKNLTAEQRVQAFQTIFGNDAMGAAATLASGGGEAYAAFAKKMADAAGVQAAAAGTQKGFNVAMDNLKGSLEALQITIGSYLLPILTDLFNNYLAPGVNYVRDLVTSFAGAQDKVGFLSKTFGDFSPVMEEFGAQFNAAKKIIGDVMALINSIVGQYLKLITEWFDKNGADIKRTMEVAFNGIKDIVTLVMKLLQATIIPALTAIAGFIKNHGDEIKMVFDTVWTVIKTLITTALTVIQNIIKIVLALINGDTKTAMDLLFQTFDVILKAIQTIFTTVFNLIWSFIKGAMTNIYNTIKTQMELARAKVLEQVNNILADVTRVFTTIVAEVVSKVTEIYNSIVTWFTNARDRAIALVGEMLTGISNTMIRIRDSIINAIKDAVNFITSPSALSDFISAGIKMVESIVRGIKDSASKVVDNLWAVVRGALDKVFEELKRFISNPFGYFGLSIPSIGSLIGIKSSPVDGVGGNPKLPQSISTVTNVTNNYNLSVASAQSQGSVVYDFGIMRAIALGAH